uniref:Uncharacterized protein n=1 Tax=Lepeophtheirus salmonis TaxID=72036 RepID=A0A0K2V600_LEPSM
MEITALICMEDPPTEILSLTKENKEHIHYVKKAFNNGIITERKATSGKLQS